MTDRHDDRDAPPKPSTLPAELEAEPSVALEAHLVTRTQAAELVGVSRSTIKRLHDQELHPITDDKGQSLYNLEEVERVRIKRTRGWGPPAAPAATAAADDGALAAELFALFDEGKDPVDVVKERRVAPRVAGEAYAIWARWRRRVVLHPETLEKLNQLLLMANIRSEAELVRELQMVLESYSHAWTEEQARRRAIQEKARILQEQQEQREQAEHDRRMAETLDPLQAPPWMGKVAAGSLLPGDLWPSHPAPPTPKPAPLSDPSPRASSRRKSKSKKGSGR
ncbi:MAG: hypothetical protein IT378_23995 [Sandaracinaceae bacterium]|nr:hypothetical protein [Sandaracinaceae bacterium]